MQGNHAQRWIERGLTAFATGVCVVHRPPYVVWRNPPTDFRSRGSVSKNPARVIGVAAVAIQVRNRKEAGQSITFSEACLENRDYALAIKREFRSWARAVEAAFSEV